MNKSQAALELRKALQLFLGTLDAETQTEAILSVPSVFPKWEAGKNFKTKAVIGYGENSVGDVQLYQVLQDHTSSTEWTPDTAVSLYKKIGITDDGTPEWVQPLGDSDAYHLGDVVAHGGQMWVCALTDGNGNNIWEPGVYGWEVKA